jgi:hemin uptake protein HemP
MNNSYEDSWLFWAGNDARATTVLEQDEVRITRILDHNGQPYTLRRPKIKLGFDLTANNV